jgi:hypothetical protein
MCESFLQIQKYRACWFIFIGYILLTKTLPYQGHRISRRFIAEYLFNNGNGLIMQDLHRISLRSKGSGGGNTFETLQLNKVGFPYRSFGRPEVVSGHKSHKVSVQNLFGRPTGHELPIAPICKLFGREPQRALVCKDIRTLK